MSGRSSLEDYAPRPRTGCAGTSAPHAISLSRGSFGAYAALQSAIPAPDLFRCAVGLAGVYDLTLMSSIGDIPETHLARGYVKRVLGDDEAALKRSSPIYNSDKLKARGSSSSTASRAGARPSSTPSACATRSPPPARRRSGCPSWS